MHIEPAKPQLRSPAGGGVRSSNMAIQITRADPLANVGTESHAPGILSVERNETMDAALASLRARGIPLTDAQAEQFRAHPDTQFSWTEFVHGGQVAYQARVAYDVREVTP